LVVGFTWWWRADLFRTSVRTNAQKDVAEIVKNYAQALVWLAAGLFFVYKTFSGTSRDMRELLARQTWAALAASNA